MTTLFSDLITPETLSGLRTKAIGFAQTAGLTIMNWIVGAVGQQTLEASVQMAYASTQIFTKLVRSFASLDTSTDPGDVDSFDPNNVNLTPAAGGLSFFGENTFGTTREGQTFATGFVTFVNGGVVPRTFSPYGLVFTWTANSPPNPNPTYKNAPDTSIYIGGTVTVNPGASLIIPIVADEVGSRSSVAAASSITLTTTLSGCTATNSAAVLGADREDADVYRARCRQAPGRISLGGPQAAYEYLAAKNIDGSPLYNAATPAAPVNINRVYVSQDSTTGIVNAYYASPSGGAIAADVTAANANIQAQAFAVPDAITFTGASASPVSVHVVGSVKIKAGPGVTSAMVIAAILKALGTEFENIPIGGKDRVAGAGVIYTDDLQAVVAASYPGVYNALVTTPAGATTALSLGQVATLNSTLTDWTVTVVP